MHALYTCTYIYRCRPLIMWQDFEGGIYWDKLAETCCDTSRVEGFQGVARFAEIQYTQECVMYIYMTLYVYLIVIT